MNYFLILTILFFIFSNNCFAINISDSTFINDSIRVSENEDKSEKRILLGIAKPFSKQGIISMTNYDDELNSGIVGTFNAGISINSSKSLFFEFSFLFASEISSGYDKYLFSILLNWYFFDKNNKDIFRPYIQFGILDILVGYKFGIACDLIIQKNLFLNFNCTMVRRDLVIWGKFPPTLLLNLSLGYKTE
jgi:hypothetical protein